MENVFPLAPNKYDSQGHQEDTVNDEFTHDRADDVLASFKLPINFEINQEAITRGVKIESKV